MAEKYTTKRKKIVKKTWNRKTKTKDGHKKNVHMHTTDQTHRTTTTHTIITHKLPPKKEKLIPPKYRQTQWNWPKNAATQKKTSFLTKIGIKLIPINTVTQKKIGPTKIHSHKCRIS